MPNKQIDAGEADRLVLPGEAARQLHVTTRTLQRMAKRGEIRAVTLPSGHRRYSQSAIDMIRGAWPAQAAGAV